MHCKSPKAGYKIKLYLKTTFFRDYLLTSFRFLQNIAYISIFPPTSNNATLSTRCIPSSGSLILGNTVNQCLRLCCPSPFHLLSIVLWGRWALVPKASALASTLTSCRLHAGLCPRELGKPIVLCLHCLCSCPLLLSFFLPRCLSPISTNASVTHSSRLSQAPISPCKFFLPLQSIPVRNTGSQLNWTPREAKSSIYAY